jgi:hypothetical protein
MAMLFQGSEGWVCVSRQGMQAEPKSLLKAMIKPNDLQVMRSNDHRRNFLTAIRTGQKTISPIEAAVHSDMVCHQADIAMRLGRKLHWDPVLEAFAGNEQANRLLSRAMRSPWRLS